MAVSAIFAIGATATASLIIGFGAAAIAIGIGAAAIMNYAMDSMMEDVAVDTMSNRNTTSKATVAPRQVVYGKCRTGGVIVYENTSADFADTEGENAYLHQFIAFCQGEVENIETVYFDEVICAERDGNGTLRYKNQYKKSQGSDTVGNHVLLTLKNGTDTQSAITGSSSAAVDTSGVIPSEWTSSHKLSGVCYLYAQMHHEPEVYEGKTPKISAVIKGKKLYDPTYDALESDWREGQQSGHNKNDPSTWEWSDNPVLILLDYMMSEEYGLGEKLESFNAASAVQAYNYCDQLVNLHPSGQEKRFTCNGIVTADNSHRKNIENILSSMNGQLLYSNGQYHIKAYQFTSVSSQVVDESILINQFDVVTKASRRDLYNVVKGKFISDEHNYQMTEYPQQKSGLKDANYPAIGNEYEYDDGETLAQEYDLPMTTSNTMAQRLAYLLLLRSRLQTTVKFETNMKGLLYTVGDNINITNEAIGYQNKKFNIINLTVSPDPKSGIKVTIEAQENNQGIYNWQADTATDFTTQGTVTVGNLDVEPPTNLRVFPRLDNIDESLQMDWDISFNKSNDPRISHYELSWRHLNDVETQSLNIGLGNIATLFDFNNGEEYLIQVKAVAQNGAKSSALYDFYEFTLPTSFIPQYIAISQNDLTPPSESQMEVYLGRPPQSGDIFNIVDLDDNVPVDSALYIFEPEMTFAYTQMTDYAQLNNQNDAVIAFAVTYREQGITPTWSYQKTDNPSHTNAFQKTYGDLTDFEGITTATTTANGYSTFIVTVTHTPAENQAETNNHTFQQGYIKVSATVGISTHSVDVFVLTSIVR